jgi:hypothetical protein
MPTVSVAEPIDRRLARLQRALGVTADGILGPETMTALEARILSQRQLARVPFSLEVSRAGLDLLVAFEVTSRAYYEKKLRRPMWLDGAAVRTSHAGSLSARRQAGAGRASDDPVPLRLPNSSS